MDNIMNNNYIFKYKFAFIFFIMLFISIFERFIFSMQPDTSFFISYLEGSLNGMVIGKDILDVNPPTSFVMFLPGIYIGKYLNIKSEFGIYFTTYMIFFASIYLFRYIDKVSELLRDKDRKFFYLIYTFIFIVYYQDIFAQREQYAIMLLMPFLALQASYLDGKHNISISVKSVAGILAGFSCVMKPHFIFPLLILLFYSMVLTKNIKYVIKFENFIMIFTSILYIALCFYFYIEFLYYVKDSIGIYYALDYMPLQFILRARHSISYIVLLLIIIFIQHKHPKMKEYKILNVFLITSIGFYGVYLLQWKGFPYHIYPALVLTFLCFTIYWKNIIEQLKILNVPKKDTVIAYLGFLFFSLFFLTEGFATLHLVPSNRDVERAVLDIAKKPKILSLTRDIAEGHPLVRDVNGLWVGSFPSLWAYAFVLQDSELPLILIDNYKDLPIKQKQLFETRRRTAIRQLKIAAKDIEERKPDIVILSQNNIWKQFIFSDPDMVHAMDDYEHAANVDLIELWKRKELPIENTQSK